MRSASQTQVSTEVTWESCSDAGSDLVGLEWGWRSFVSNKFLGKDDAAGYSLVPSESARG